MFEVGKVYKRKGLQGIINDVLVYQVRENGEALVRYLEHPSHVGIMMQSESTGESDTPLPDWAQDAVEGTDNPAFTSDQETANSKAEDMAEGANEADA